MKFEKREISQIDWHLEQIENYIDVEENIWSIRQILKRIDKK